MFLFLLKAKLGLAMTIVDKNENLSTKMKICQQKFFCFCRKIASPKANVCKSENWCPAKHIKHSPSLIVSSYGSVEVRSVHRAEMC